MSVHICTKINLQKLQITKETGSQIASSFTKTVSIHNFHDEAQEFSFMLQTQVKETLFYSSLITSPFIPQLPLSELTTKFGRLSSNSNNISLQTHSQTEHTLKFLLWAFSTNISAQIKKRLAWTNECTWLANIVNTVLLYKHTRTPRLHALEQLLKRRKENGKGLSWEIVNHFEVHTIFSTEKTWGFVYIMMQR